MLVLAPDIQLKTFYENVCLLFYPVMATKTYKAVVAMCHCAMFRDHFIHVLLTSCHHYACFPHHIYYMSTVSLLREFKSPKKFFSIFTNER